MAALPEPAPVQKKTMMGITTVDQGELQRAIAAARAATAAGETPKKTAKRTMMGVAAVKVPTTAKTAATPGIGNEGWGAAGGGAAGGTPAAVAEALDEGWGLPDDEDEPVAPAVAAPEPEPRKRTTDPGPLAAAEASSAPTLAPRGSAPVPMAPRATVAMSSMAAPPTAPAPTAAPPRPTTGSRGTGTVAFESAPPGALEPKPAPPRPTTGSRATAVLGAMAPLPTAPATKPAPQPSAPAVESVGLADTLAGDRKAPEAVAAPRPESAESGAISPSSPDPLADTISPGSMRLEEILRDAEASGAAAAMAAAAKAAPQPTAPQPTAPQTAAPPPGAYGAAATAPTVGPITAPSVPASSPATTTATGLKKVGTTTHPPFLASKALAEDMHPTEPGRGQMRAIAIAGGAALAALWAVPLSFDPLTFAWTAAMGLSGAAQVFAFFTPAAGVLMLLFGVLPVPYRVRALGALVVGTVPLVLAVGGLGPLEPARGWPGAVLTAGMILLPGALMHRANYRGSVLARVLVALGMLLMLAWMFVPGASGMPAAVVDGFGSARALPQSIAMIAALVLLAASLLAFMPSATTAGTAITGRLMIFVRPLLFGVGAVAAGTASAAPVALGVGAATLLVYIALASLGMAQTLASLERPARRR